MYAKLKKMFMSHNDNGFLDRVMYLIVGIIGLVAVAIPVTTTTVNNVTPSLAGVPATILPHVTTFVVLGVLMFVARNFLGGSQ